VFFSGLKSLVGIPSSANATQSTTSFQNGDGFGSLGFQRNMLANVGTPVTTPIVRYGGGPTSISQYTGAIIDNTGNVWGVGFNAGGTFGNGTVTNITTFQQLNQYFPESLRARNIMFNGYAGIQGGTIVSLEDGTIVVAGTNQSGMLPYETNATAATSPAMPYYRYAIGFGKTDKI
jgi:hypothetical protein